MPFCVLLEDDNDVLCHGGKLFCSRSECDCWIEMAFLGYFLKVGEEWAY
jgi:hypothetical protein